ncbi:hypothetical protein OS493_011453 [Desmophyllum pertusum]|uniref:Helicase Helix-turn-helix domain-containing protein n=1 Tax=Desmophyllum pertusum TaxID=174260 RepID=A0A9X0CNC6_9CNID|nr:hypothetical protein OS493_011453 [Desmophyllum pertusum]
MFILLKNRSDGLALNIACSAISAQPCMFNARSRLAAETSCKNSQKRCMSQTSRFCITRRIILAALSDKAFLYPPGKRASTTQPRGDGPSASKRTKLPSCKVELYRLYGKNNLSPQKRLVMNGLKLGKNFSTLATELNVVQATAEFYGIDCLAAGSDVNHESVAEYLNVNKRSFEIIKTEIMANEDKKLRTVWDNLGQAYSYNQIRFVLACLIHDHDLQL